MSPGREGELERETDTHLATLAQLEASPMIKQAKRDAEIVAAEKRAQRAAKKEVKARKVEEAKAKGYEKREWSVSMLVLYDDYYERGEKLHTARKAYMSFRKRFDQKGKTMTHDDHIRAAALAEAWETAAERYVAPHHFVYTPFPCCPRSFYAFLLHFYFGF
jgi:hypothetical protein